MSSALLSWRRARFALPMFLSAVLSFAVQPLLGRHLLPGFGGAPAVWISCLFLFQLGLLLGYALAHALVTHASVRAQLACVGAALALCALRGPLTLPPLAAASAESPEWLIARFFAAQVAPAYVALTLAAPLLQHWYARSTGQEPYGLYAVSNAGSFVGLLGYPLLIEPALDLPDQARLFSAGFIAYALSMMGTVLESSIVRAPAAPSRESGTSHPRAAWLWWLLLSAAPSALLCSVSNHVTSEVAATPLLWVLPLSLYLASFVLTFGGRARLPRTYTALWFAATIALPSLLVTRGPPPLPLLLAVPLLTLFAGCMLCHGQLVALRPSAGSTSFYYVCIAAGGALGSSLVAVVAPLTLRDLYELPLSMLAIHALLLARARGSPRHDRRWAFLGFGLALPLLCGTLYAQGLVRGEGSVLVARSRSFFGPLRVADLPPMRVLRHGRTNHGMQWLDPARRREPVSYYGLDTGAGRVLRGLHPGAPRNLGVVGLGAGTIATYARPGDHVRFFEINEAVVSLSRRHFTYLRDCAAPVDIVRGDGRLQLAAERAARPYDVLVLDAFSSDSVPVHLLTREAFALYLSRLAPDGVLVANVANRHLRVERAVVGSARAHGLSALMLDSPADIERGYARARFVLVARPSVDLTRFEGPPSRTVAVRDPVVFTDRRASLLSLVR